MGAAPPALSPAQDPAATADRRRSMAWPTLSAWDAAYRDPGWKGTDKPVAGRGMGTTQQDGVVKRKAEKREDNRAGIGRRG